MEYSTYKCDNYNVHIIKTDRFRTLSMEIMFRDNFDPKITAERSILFEMLLENSKKYKTVRELALKEEELFGSTVSNYSISLGSMVISNIVLDSFSPKYLGDLLESVLELPFELIFNPNIKSGKFDKKTLEIVKTRTKNDIESIKENPAILALMNAYKFMDETSPISKNVLGTCEEVDKITTSSLYEMYNKVLSNDLIDIFVIGNVDTDEVVNIINKYAKFEERSNRYIPFEVSLDVAPTPKEKCEKSNNELSQIVMIYNTVDLTDFEKKYVMHIYNRILGGGSLETKLYRNLRGDNSLCYSVSSRYNRYNNLITISTGVHKDNIDRVKKEIIKTVNEMNNITLDELNISVSGIISSIKMVMDTPSSIVADCLFNKLGILESVDKRIESYKSVTIDDLLKLNDKIKLNTIYVLEGE